jgi:hypothetical protein
MMYFDVLFGNGSDSTTDENVLPECDSHDNRISLCTLLSDASKNDFSSLPKAIALHHKTVDFNSA